LRLCAERLYRCANLYAAPEPARDPRCRLTDNFNGFS
jgi:hypothetical protein